MIILAADTSTSMGSVALRNPGGSVLSASLDSSRPHSETLLKAVAQILAEAGLAREDIDAIAVGTGPGAFTGLRVGLATFKAWAFASTLPLVPVSSMDAIAWPVLERGTSAIVLADARKGEVYAAYYPSIDGDSLPVMMDDILLIPQTEVPAWVSTIGDQEARLTGTALPLLAESGIKIGDLPVAECTGVPNAVDLVELAEKLFILGRTVEPAGLVPTYVRQPDADKPARGIVTAGPPGSGD